MDQSDEKVIDSLKIHYADEDSYVLDLINLVKEKMQNPEGRSLVVGCSVGRAVLEFSKVF